ncbi:unnamed protein product [Effrenium voratum]|uniref:Uncharacterized protein n=1 Tax=Effrenium voratum TaxID=2562239 RepID=A0AA36N830_9DINO|nr:unnamed protein product [Effrenium voratum]
MFSEDRNLLDFALSLYNGHVDPKKIESCLTEVLSEIDAFGKRGGLAVRERSAEKRHGSLQRMVHRGG